MVESVKSKKLHCRPRRCVVPAANTDVLSLLQPFLLGERYEALCRMPVFGSCALYGVVANLSVSGLELYPVGHCRCQDAFRLRSFTPP